MSAARPAARSPLQEAVRLRTNVVAGMSRITPSGLFSTIRRRWRGPAPCCARWAPDDGPGDKAGLAHLFGNQRSDARCCRIIRGSVKSAPCARSIGPKQAVFATKPATAWGKRLRESAKAAIRRPGKNEGWIADMRYELE